MGGVASASFPTTFPNTLHSSSRYNAWNSPRVPFESPCFFKVSQGGGEHGAPRMEIAGAKVVARNYRESTRIPRSSACSRPKLRRITSACSYRIDGRRKKAGATEGRACVWIRARSRNPGNSRHTYEYEYVRPDVLYRGRASFREYLPGHAQTRGNLLSIRAEGSAAITSFQVN